MPPGLGVLWDIWGWVGQRLRFGGGELMVRRYRFRSTAFAFGPAPRPHPRIRHGNGLTRQLTRPASDSPASHHSAEPGCYIYGLTSGRQLTCAPIVYACMDAWMHTYNCVPNCVKYTQRNTYILCLYSVYTYTFIHACMHACMRT